jgi:hypothetical protein
MWSDLADEVDTRRATFNRAQDAFNEGRMVQQQEQPQAKKPEDDKS